MLVSVCATGLMFDVLTLQKTSEGASSRRSRCRRSVTVLIKRAKADEASSFSPWISHKKYPRMLKLAVSDALVKFKLQMWNNTACCKFKIAQKGPHFTLNSVKQRDAPSLLSWVFSISFTRQRQ